MKHVVLFIDDAELRAMVRQLDEYQVLYFSTELISDNLPEKIDLAIFDFDIVPVSLLDEWSQFPRLHIRKMAVVSADNLDKVERVLEQLDNYVVRPLSYELLHFRFKAFSKTPSDFIRFISMEIRNPLVSIAGYSQLIQKMYESFEQDKILEFMKVIENNANRIRGMLHQYVDYFSIEKDKNYRFNRIKMNNIYNRDVITELVAKKSQTFNILVSENLPYVYGDEFKLEFVLHALIDNACKYSDEGSEIQLIVEVEHGYLLCMVKDQGYGIPKESQERIFEQFYRGDLPAVHEQYGQGMSLYLCKQIIEVHGGKIWFESEVGVGTTFYFTLPLAQ